ncbi:MULTISPECIES: DMT family transporter [unclassified Clostridium]|uniref:DMT family transporter n=1 Tax=unclassified Clostridium TaxID=2614128 RepID=UPI0025B7AFA3|nr:MULTISPECIES: DMT family transporter [unclassified Clostridium]
MNRKAKADFMLLMITIFWGASYILTKIGLETFEPFNLIALRFIIAFGISAIVFKKQVFKTDVRTIKYALILSIILFGVFISMTFGLKYISASNAGFLISLSVVLIPVISFIFLKQKIDKKVIGGVCLALIGIALLTLNTELRLSSGDILCILCALLFATHIVVTSIFTQKVDSIALGVLQLGFVGIFSVVFSMLIETVKLPSNTTSWFVVLSLSILCTAVGYIVQTTAQQYTSATHTGLILSLEPVFSAVFAYVFLGEILTKKGYVGAVILLLSVLIAELDFKKKSQPQSVYK